MTSLLVGVEPHEPVTLAMTAAALLAVALLAAWRPAMRAAHVDPGTALRDA
jgi:putative ABC transport system permease protein